MSLPNTLVFTFMQKCVKTNYNREILKTLDGGRIAIDWSNKDSPKKLILIHLTGFNGSSYDNYATHIVAEAGLLVYFKLFAVL